MKVGWDHPKSLALDTDLAAGVLPELPCRPNRSALHPPGRARTPEQHMRLFGGFYLVFQGGISTSTIFYHLLPMLLVRMPIAEHSWQKRYTRTSHQSLVPEKQPTSLCELLIPFYTSRLSLPKGRIPQRPNTNRPTRKRGQVLGNRRGQGDPPTDRHSRQPRPAKGHDTRRTIFEVQSSEGAQSLNPSPEQLWHAWKHEGVQGRLLKQTPPTFVPKRGHLPRVKDKLPKQFQSRHTRPTCRTGGVPSQCGQPLTQYTAKGFVHLRTRLKKANTGTPSTNGKTSNLKWNHCRPIHLHERLGNRNMHVRQARSQLLVSLDDAKQVPIGSTPCPCHHHLLRLSIGVTVENGQYTFLTDQTFRVPMCLNPSYDTRSPGTLACQTAEKGPQIPMLQRGLPQPPFSRQLEQSRDTSHNLLVIAKYRGDLEGRQGDSNGQKLSSVAGLIQTRNQTWPNHLILSRGKSQDHRTSWNA